MREIGRRESNCGVGVARGRCGAGESLGVELQKGGRARKEYLGADLWESAGQVSIAGEGCVRKVGEQEVGLRESWASRAGGVGAAGRGGEARQELEWQSELRAVQS